MLSDRPPTTDKYEDVPEPIREAFAGRSLLSLPKTAKALTMSIKVLRRHTDAGDIQCRYIGFGLIRTRRFYTLSDVAAFLKVLTGKRQVVRVWPEPSGIYAARDRWNGRGKSKPKTLRADTRKF